MPLRAIRERLRLIRYYSATRRYGRWSRMLDMAVVTALIAAWPAAWLLDRSCVRVGEPFTISGFLYEDPDEQVWVWLSPPPMPPSDVRGDAAFIGSFRIDLRGEDHGWPFVTSHGPRRLALNVEIFDEPRSLGAQDLPPGSPVRHAINSALETFGDTRLAAATWDGSAIAGSNRAKGWVANGLVLSVLLVLAASGLVALLRIGSLFRIAEKRQRVAQRRETNRCTACGYDLHGSVFSERCPECGTLV
jgi:hypothetical protein